MVGARRRRVGAPYFRIMLHFRSLLVALASVLTLAAGAQSRKEQIAELGERVDSLCTALGASVAHVRQVEAERARWQEKAMGLQAALDDSTQELRAVRQVLDWMESRVDSLSSLLTKERVVPDVDMSYLLSFYRDTTFNEVCFPGMHVQGRTPWDEDAANVPGRLDVRAIATAQWMSIGCANMSVNSSDDVSFNPIGVYSFRISDDQLGLVVQVFGELASFDTHLWVLDRTQRRIIADVLLQTSSGDAGYSINAGACLFVDNEALFNVMYRSFSSYLEPGIEPDGTEDTQPEEKTNWALMRITANGVDTVTTDGERIRQLQPRLHHQLAKAIGR